MKRLVGAAAMAAVLFAGDARSEAGWRTVVDARGGFSIAVPAAWQVVPRSTAGLNARIAELSKRKRAALANQFAEIRAARHSTHTVYRFQAFAWPAPKGVVVPDVTVKVDRLSPGTTARSLPLIARQVGKALARSKATTVSAPVATRLPAGRAFSVTGVVRLSKTLRSRFLVYLLIGKGRLYSIAFRGPPTPVEQRIAQSIRLR